MRVLPCLPNRSAPRVDGQIALGTVWCGKDVGDTDLSSILRRGKAGPLAARRSRQVHVCELNFASCIAALKVKVETDESEGRVDGLAFCRGVLRGESINGVLVDERRIAVAERVEAQFVELRLLVDVGVHVRRAIGVRTRRLRPRRSRRLKNLRLRSRRRN